MWLPLLPARLPTAWTEVTQGDGSYSLTYEKAWLAKKERAWLQYQTSALHLLFLRAPGRLIHTGAAEQKHMLLVPAWDYT